MPIQTKAYWVKKFGLIKHPEGGYYRQTFWSENRVTLSDTTKRTHRAGTSIYYLLGSPSIGDFSAWHRLINLEEIWHYHYGSDLIIYLIDEKNNLLIEKHLGINQNAELQVHIPANTWFCAVVDDSHQEAYTLAGCTVSPGFDFEDFEIADRKVLSERFPQHREIIQKYTRPNNVYR